MNKQVNKQSLIKTNTRIQGREDLFGRGQISFSKREKRDETNN